MKTAFKPLAGDDNPYTALAGTSFAVDFNPVADRLRVTGNTGQNLRINADTGDVATDGVVIPGSTTVTAAASTNSFAGTTATQLFNLDQNAHQLTLQNPPNDGTLVNIGPLGLDVSGAAGFDIGGGGNGLVLAALRTGATGPFSLYTVSLTAGAATFYRNTSGNTALSQIGGAGGPGNLIDIAIRF